jgi:hypothetical protein
MRINGYSIWLGDTTANIDQLTLFALLWPSQEHSEVTVHHTDVRCCVHLLHIVRALQSGYPGAIPSDFIIEKSIVETLRSVYSVGMGTSHLTWQRCVHTSLAGACCTPVSASGLERAASPAVDPTA